jgi:isoleucyl-tRNA synthetase
MMRTNKNIGKGLDAGVTILASEGSAAGLVLAKYEGALAEFFNVSQASVQMIAASTNAAAVAVEVEVASGSKCGRCWRVVPDVGADGRWSEVCARCADALEAIGFAPMQREAV